MATRCLIVIEDRHEAIVLYKHWNGYPEYMLPMLEEFARKYASEVEKADGFFPHFLWQAGDAAAALIYHYHVEERRHWAEMGKPEFTRPAPDIRPTSVQKEKALSEENCLDEDYVYHVVLKNDLTWKVRVYEKYGGLQHVKTHEIDLARFLSEETLQEYPQYRRPRNPRVKALLAKLKKNEKSESGESDAQALAEKLWKEIDSALNIKVGEGYARTTPWYRIRGRRVEAGIIPKAIKLAKSVRVLSQSGNSIRFSVPSESTGREYEVRIEASPLSFSCTCPWGEYRARPCKHVLAAALYPLQFLLDIREDLIRVGEYYITYADFEVWKILTVIHEALNRAAFLRVREGEALS